MRCVASALARAMTWDGVARRPVSHVRYDSGDTLSRAANAACDWPNAIRHSRSVRGVLQSANLGRGPVTFFATVLRVSPLSLLTVQPAPVRLLGPPVRFVKVSAKFRVPGHQSL